MTASHRDRAHRRLPGGTDEDRLAGMVFAVALVSFHQVLELLVPGEEITILKHPGTPEMEILHCKGVHIERYRVSDQKLRGEGERLGTAFRLCTGEVVHVPDAPDR